MTSEKQSAAISDADSSTFGLPEESADTETVPVLGEIHINTPSLRLNASAVVDTTKRDGREGRGLYRLVLTILLLLLGLLMEARRNGVSASLGMP